MRFLSKQDSRRGWKISSSSIRHYHYHYHYHHHHKIQWQDTTEATQHRTTHPKNTTQKLNTKSTTQNAIQYMTTRHETQHNSTTHNTTHKTTGRKTAKHTTMQQQQQQQQQQQKHPHVVFSSHRTKFFFVFFQVLDGASETSEAFKAVAGRWLREGVGSVAPRCWWVGKMEVCWVERWPGKMQLFSWKRTLLAVTAVPFQLKGRWCNITACFLLT